MRHIIIKIDKGCGFLKFTKLHGLGNDYVCVNCFEEEVLKPEKTALTICRRHFGVGADGLILVRPSKKADFCMEMYNPDGSRGMMCGNGIRCLAKYVYDSGLTKGRKNILVETDSGIRRLQLQTDNGRVSEVIVDMGVPKIYTDRGELPLLNYIKYTKSRTYRNYRGGNGGASFNINMAGARELSQMGIWKTLSVDNIEFKIVNISVGNPHAVIFCDDLDSIDVKRVGALIERHEAYPDRTNVEFVKVIDSGHIEVRVWERGAGETLACGTGACAACSAAIAAEKIINSVKVVLPGGELMLGFNTATGHLIMRGAVAEVFRGEI